MKHGSAGTYNRGCRCEECKAARRAYDQARYRKDPEPYKKRARDWEAANPERRQALQQAWREANRDKERARAERYRRAHRKLANQRAADWARRNPDKVRAKQARWQQSPQGKAARAAIRSKRRGAAFTEEAREYAAILRNDPCSYCGNHAEAIDHITPVVSGGDGEWSNLTAACHACNRRKWTHQLLRFLAAA